MPGLRIAGGPAGRSISSSGRRGEGKGKYSVSRSISGPWTGGGVVGGFVVVDVVVVVIGVVVVVVDGAIVTGVVGEGFTGACVG